MPVWSRASDKKKGYVRPITDDDDDSKGLHKPMHTRKSDTGNKSQTNRPRGWIWVFMVLNLVVIAVFIFNSAYYFPSMSLDGIVERTLHQPNMQDHEEDNGDPSNPTPCSVEPLSRTIQVPTQVPSPAHTIESREVRPEELVEGSLALEEARTEQPVKDMPKKLKDEFSTMEDRKDETDNQKERAGDAQDALLSVHMGATIVDSIPAFGENSPSVVESTEKTTMDLSRPEELKIESRLEQTKIPTALSDTEVPNQLPPNIANLLALLKAKAAIKSSPAGPEHSSEQALHDDSTPLLTTVPAKLISEPLPESSHIEPGMTLTEPRHDAANIYVAPLISENEQTEEPPKKSDDISSSPPASDSIGLTETREQKPTPEEYEELTEEPATFDPDNVFEWLPSKALLAANEHQKPASVLLTEWTDAVKEKINAIRNFPFGSSVLRTYIRERKEELIELRQELFGYRVNTHNL